MKALVIDNLNKSFGRVRAVVDFSLEIEEGEFVTLLGPSGCGKTTVLRSIAGFEKPDSGKIFIFGELSNDIPPEKRDVGMVFQNYALFPNMTVAQNVAFPMMIKKVPQDEIRKRVKELLELVQLSGLENRYTHQLSGGQKQRVALARALAKRPKILLLDEPLSALDAKVRQQLRGEIRKLQKRLGITTVFVTHDQEEALTMSDRIIVMRDGRIQQVGTPQEVYDDPSNLFVAHFVGTSSFLKGEMRDGVFVWKGKKIVTGRKKVNEGKAVLVLRPNVLKIFRKTEEVPKDFNIFEGEVTLVTFLGPVVKIHVSVGETEILVEIPRTDFRGFNEGEKVLIGFSPNDIIALPVDENPI